MALFLLALVLFVILDIAIRAMLKKIHNDKQLKERQEALAVSLKLDYIREAKSLKRAEVKEPKAKILCVDDEAVILDSFRKILVLDGYAVDTVESGPEALGLIRAHHYDFVFTDLKMPDMSGEDVVKSVKHLRPDIDVLVITGYATVESAVECMKFGAMDYIQKPFTEDELLALTTKSLIKRQDRIQKQLKPIVHITRFPGAEKFQRNGFSIPGGVFISPNHCWASMETEGCLHVGIDDFAKKLIGSIDSIEMPNLGMNVAVGQPLFTLKQGQRTLQFKSPVSGKVSKINSGLVQEPERLDITPYDGNWICILDPVNIDTDLKELKIGKAAVDFYHADLEAFQNSVKNLNLENNGTHDALHSGDMAKLDEKNWRMVTGTLFDR